ncbi:DUF4221 family protein [Marivirga arenosa]|uniref:DUF4221 family protein n=1 Tax=Marivirga arenosa TaxID=3059076 RepID=A0AA51ZXH3_9BACT|nr:DUF4221 family protein [Marivirga sp. BKB1-2]WNB18538.1 DUF4221 family protein [Marivirga sp. BKB1-2]
MNKSFLYLAIIFCLYSCTKEKKDVENKPIKLNFTLKEIKKISINDSVINTKNVDFFIYENGIFIYSVEDFDNFYECFFYSLNDSTKNFNLKILREGPNGVGKLDLPILPESPDSFFALNTNSEFFHLNSKGEILKKSKIVLPDSIKRPEVKEFAKLQRSGGYFIMEPISINWDGYYDKHLTIKYDFNRNNFQTILSNYPDFMRQGNSFGVSSWNFSRTINKKGHFLYSFNYDPNLYVFDELKLIRKVPTNIPDLREGDKSPISEEATFNEQLEYFMKRSQFLELYSDEITGNTVRVVHDGMTDEKLEVDRNWWDKDLFIQVFDSDYNYVGYESFEAKKFSSASLFYHDGLLYMPYHNKSNDDTVEDKFIIHVYEIEI